MNRKADWLASGLPLIVGLVLGVLLGSLVTLIALAFMDWWLTGAVAAFVMGAALLVAAIASLSGDRLWMGNKVIPADEPQQNRVSAICAVLIGLTGIGLMAYALWRVFDIV